ncbi:MAG: hypothetical protein COB35_12050 [Gammaproteobacteria bacterium]|nr:MAG: hypothetical protein COB35_12050 [Gammaproteobacteria bacterium]
MTPTQMKELRELSLLFKQGKANPSSIKKLSELLANINSNTEELDALNFINDIQFHSRLSNSVF